MNSYSDLSNTFPSIDLNKNTIIVASFQQKYSCLESESVILNLQDEKYYSLNKSGGVIWEFIQQPVAFDRLIKCLENPALETELKIFLLELAAVGLVIEAETEDLNRDVAVKITSGPKLTCLGSMKELVAAGSGSAGDGMGGGFDVNDTPPDPTSVLDFVGTGQDDTGTDDSTV